MNSKTTLEELYGLVQQQTVSHVRLPVYNLRKRELNGLEAWRETHYGCKPQNSIRAEDLCKQIVKALPEGRAKSMPDLKCRLVSKDAQIRAHDEVAEEPMNKQVKLMGTDIPDTYVVVYKRVDGLCARLWKCARIKRLSLSACSWEALKRDLQDLGRYSQPYRTRMAAC